MIFRIILLLGVLCGSVQAQTVGNGVTPVSGCSPGAQNCPVNGFWQRQGTVAQASTPADASQMFEPTVTANDTNCQILTVLASCWKMWPASGFSSPQLNYFESPDGLTWYRNIVVGTASVFGTTLTVTVINSGPKAFGSGVLAAGQTVLINGIATGTTILTQLTGSAGGVGTYQLSASQATLTAQQFQTVWEVPAHYHANVVETKSSFTASISTTTMAVTNLVGNISVGQAITVPGGTNTTVTAIPAGGGNGAYTIANSQTVALEAMTGQEYYLYAANTAQTQIDEYESSTGLFPATPTHSAVIPLGTGGSWDALFVTNTGGVYTAGVLTLFLEGYPTSGAGTIGGFTSTDMHTLTQVGGNPIITSTTGSYAGGPDNPMFLNGAWWMRIHQGDGSGSSATKIYRAAAPSLTGPWTVNPTPVLTRITADEGVNAPASNGQVVDPFTVSYAGPNGTLCRLYYTADEYNAGYGAQHVKAADADMSCAALLITPEGDSAATLSQGQPIQPWSLVNLGTASQYPSGIWTPLNVGIGQLPGSDALDITGTETVTGQSTANDFVVNGSFTSFAGSVGIVDYNGTSMRLFSQGSSNSTLGNIDFYGQNKDGSGQQHFVNFGVNGNTTVEHILSVIGALNADAALNVTGTTTLGTVATGTGNYLCGAVSTAITLEPAACPASDERVKHSIKPIRDPLLPLRLLAKRGVSFVYNPGKGALGTHIGTIAQDWQQDFPELVTTDDDGTLHFDYQGAFGVTLAAMQVQTIVMLMLVAWCVGLTIVVLRKRSA